MLQSCLTEKTQTLTCSHPKHFYDPWLHESVDWNTKIYKPVKEDGSHTCECVTKTWLYLGSGSTAPVITSSQRKMNLKPPAQSWLTHHFWVVWAWVSWNGETSVLQALCSLLLFISIINTLLCWEKLQLILSCERKCRLIWLETCLIKSTFC